MSAGQKWSAAQHRKFKATMQAKRMEAQRSGPNTSSLKEASPDWQSLAEERSWMIQKLTGELELHRHYKRIIERLL